MRLRKRPTPEEEAAFISGAKADQAESITTTKDATTKEAAIPTPATPPSIEQMPETAPTGDSKQEQEVDPHQHVRRTEWPILPSLDPFMADGREDLDKPFVMRMKENLWCSIDRHCKALGVDKSKWIRQAILNQMAAEQQHFTELSRKR